MSITEHEAKPRRTAEEGALLLRAKEKLLAEKGMPEAQAYRWLQKQSMNYGVKMAELARRILDGE